MDTGTFERQVVALREQQLAIARSYNVFSEKVRGHLRKVLDEAGVLEVVQVLEQGLEARRDADQKTCDFLGAQIQELTLARESTTPEWVHGIDVSKLDADTAGLVRSGNPETLEVLRGS